MRTRMFLLIAAAFFIVIAAVAAIAVDITWAIPIALVAVVVGAYAGFNKALQERERGRHGGDEDEALRDSSEGGLPKAHVTGDERTALGDTPEVHAEISPHDFPKGAPERHAAEKMAAEESGPTAQREPGDTTGGHEDPSEREGRVGHESETRGG